MQYERVDRAIAEGKLWRAKEILEGRLGAAEFDPELLLRYGTVLLAMGDLVAAGRALYFSGHRAEEFGEAIGIFLSRHPRSDPKCFLSGMPHMIRRQAHLAKYLSSDEFAQSGWSSAALQSIKPPSVSIRPAVKSPWNNRLEKILTAAVALVVVLPLLSGLVTFVRFVYSLLR